MPCLEVKICERFKINKLTCFECKKLTNVSEKDFKLVRQKQRRYKNLIPYDGNYAYLKVLYDGNILAYAGNIFKKFGISKKILQKSMNDLRKSHILFREYIGPVFEQMLKDSEAYQFDFKVKDEGYSCCLYPCPIVSESISVDIVIRISQHITTDEIKDFLIKPLPNDSDIQDTTKSRTLKPDARMTTMKDDLEEHLSSSGGESNEDFKKRLSNVRKKNKYRRSNSDSITRGAKIYTV